MLRAATLSNAAWSKFFAAQPTANCRTLGRYPVAALKWSTSLKSYGPWLVLRPRNTVPGFGNGTGGADRCGVGRPALVDADGGGAAVECWACRVTTKAVYPTRAAVTATIVTLPTGKRVMTAPHRLGSAVASRVEARARRPGCGGAPS